MQIESQLPCKSVELALCVTNDMHADDGLGEHHGLPAVLNIVSRLKQQFVNCLVMDNGDLIHGGPLADADYDGREPLPIYQLMKNAGYEVFNLGNHELSFGLPYLKSALSSSAVTAVSANLVEAKQQQPLFNPYKIMKKTVIDQDGIEQTLNIGVIGFMTPRVMEWEAHLHGEVDVLDIIETAQHYIHKMREAGADLVIALSHSGLNSSPSGHQAENVSGCLSTLPGLDAVFFGHDHRVFSDAPGKSAESFAVPLLSAGQRGSHVALLKLQLLPSGDGWKVVKSEASNVETAM